MKMSRNFGAMALSGAMTLSACGGSRQETKAPSKEPIKRELLDMRGPSINGEPTEKQPEKPSKPYLSPPEDMGEFMDVLVICLATRDAARAFVTTESKIPSTKGCRIIQATHDQGANVIEACTPVVESKLPMDMDLMGSIQMLRLEIASLQKQMEQLKDVNPHCFGQKKKPKTPTIDPGSFTTAGRGSF